MFQQLRWLLPATAAMALLIGWSVSTAKAAEEKANGSIKGTVVDKDDKAVEGVRITLTKPRERGAGGGGGGAAQRPEPLATATTDKDGKFELTFDTKKVPDGDYRVSGGNRDKGFARATVTIKDGKAVDKDGKATTLSLKLGTMQRRGGGGGGQ